MKSTLDFPEVFSRLCHMAALSKEGKIKAAIDNLVLTIFAISERDDLSNAKQVVASINAYFNLSLKEFTVQGSIDTLMSSGSLVRDRVTKIIALAPAKKTEIEFHINAANQLEQQVHDGTWRF